MEHVSCVSSERRDGVEGGGLGEGGWVVQSVIQFN